MNTRQIKEKRKKIDKEITDSIEWIKEYLDEFALDVYDPNTGGPCWEPPDTIRRVESHEILDYMDTEHREHLYKKAKVDNLEVHEAYDRAMGVI